MRNINKIKIGFLTLLSIISIRVNSQIPNQGNSVKIGQYFPSLIPNNGNWNPFPNYIFTNMYLLAQYTGGSETPTSNPGDFTSDGWPTVEFILQMPNIFQAGTHYIEFQGIANVNLWGSAIVVENMKLSQEYNAATQKTCARFTMGIAGGSFNLSFTNVRSASIQNIKIYGPQYLTGIGASAIPIANMPTFTNELYKALAPYPAIDFDAVLEPDAQNNGEVTWAGRTIPGQIQYSQAQIVSRTDYYTGPGNNTGSFMYPNDDTVYNRQYNVNPASIGGKFINGHEVQYSFTSKGMAYEYIIDYANTTGKDIMIYVPECANDEYILNLAILIKNNLTNPNAHIYVSMVPSVISRPSGNYETAMGKMELAYGLTDIGFDSATNANYRAPYNGTDVSIRRNLARSFTVSTTLCMVSGIQNMMVKYRPVWYPNTSDFSDALAYLNYKTPNPEQFFYAILAARQYSSSDKADYAWPAIQDCFPVNDPLSNDKDADNWAAMPEDSCINRLKMSINTISQDENIYIFRSLASWLNMKLILFQSGPNSFSWCNLDSAGGAPYGKLLAQHDTRFTQMQRNYYQAIWGTGVDEANYYQFLGGPENEEGIWDAINDSTLSPGVLLPKYSGLKAAIQDKNPGITMGNPLSATATTTIRGGFTDCNFTILNTQNSYLKEDVGWSNPNDSANYATEGQNSPATWSYMLISQGNNNKHYSYNFDFYASNGAGNYDIWLNNRKITTVSVTSKGWYPAIPIQLKLRPGQNCLKINSLYTGTGTGPYLVINYIRFLDPTPYIPKKYSVKVYNGSILNAITGQLDTSTLRNPAIMDSVPEETNLLIMAQSPVLKNRKINYSKVFEQWDPVDYYDSSKVIEADTIDFEGTGGRFDNIIGIYVDTILSFKPIFGQADSFEIEVTDGILPVPGSGTDHNYYYASERVPLLSMNYATDSGEIITQSVFNRWEGTSQYLPFFYNGAPYIEDIYSDSTIINMPKENIWIIGLYRLENEYELKINGGTPADGFYYQGQKITIDANQIQPGESVQWEWTDTTISIPLSNYVADIYSAVTSVIQPNMDMEITAVYSTGGDTGMHQLIVNSGMIAGGTLDPTGKFSTGIFPSNAQVSITCFSPSAGSTFNHWTGDVQFINNVDTMSAIVTMPDGGDTISGVSLTATYQPIPGTYTLTVVNGVCDNGTNTGYYYPGDTVIVGANTPLVGEVFYEWIAINPLNGDTLNAPVADPFTGSTYLIMPGKNIMLEATYTVKTYSLTVINGTGSGNYSVGDSVTIIANAAPAGMIFKQWKGFNFFNLINDSLADTTYITMTCENVIVEALYKPINTGQVALNVIFGTGSGAYNPGAVVDVSADSSVSAGYAQGYKFDQWTGDTTYINNIRAENAVVTLPNTPNTSIILQANYQSIKYKLTINRGSVVENVSADCLYSFGTTVFIQANSVSSDSVFAAWTGDTETIGQQNVPFTTIVIPDQNTTITATYKPAIFYLTVINGSGSGFYKAGTVVPVVSNYSGKQFEVWRGDVQGNIADTLAASTTVTMPATDINIEAEEAITFCSVIIYVVSDSLVPIPDATVTIDTLKPMQTDQNGDVELQLSFGSHIAIAAANGFKTDSDAINPFNVITGYAFESFTIFMTPSINLKENEWNNLIVYPNPTSDKLMVGLPEGQILEMIVTDMPGKPIVVRNVTENDVLTLDVKWLAKGIYNITIITKDNNYRALFIVE